MSYDATSRIRLNRRDLGTTKMIHRVARRCGYRLVLVMEKSNV